MWEFIPFLEIGFEYWSIEKKENERFRVIMKVYFSPNNLENNKESGSKSNGTLLFPS